MAIRFAGFRAGDNVSLSASNGEQSPGPVSVSAWQQPSNLDITVTYPGQNAGLMAHAPAAIWFEATVPGETGLPTRTEGDVSANASYVSYDQQFHELQFEWSFGDTGTWQYAERLPTALQQRDYAHGKVTCHVFSTAGNKTVTCTAYRMGLDGSLNLTRTVVGTRTITFQDGGDYPAIPTVEDVVPIGRRLYLSSDGNYSDVPVGAVTGADLPADTYFQALSWAESQAPNPVAVFVKKGSTYAWSGTSNPPSATPFFYMGTYGTGNAPIVNRTGSAPVWGENATNFGATERGGWNTFDGIEAAGTWDSINETGDTDVPLWGGENISHLLIHNCRGRNADEIVNWQLGNDQGMTRGERSLVICDSHLDDYRDYGIFVSGNSLSAFDQHVCLIGNKLGAAPQAAMGLNGKDGNQNQHGPMRVARCYYLIVRGNDILSRHSWDTRTQGCLRMNTNSAETWNKEPGRNVVYGNVFEGGGIQVQSGAGGGAVGAPNLPTGGERAHAFPINGLVMHNLFLGAFNTEEGAGLGRTCYTIRENVFIAPDLKNWRPTNSDQVRSNASFFIGASDQGIGGNSWVPGYNDELVDHPARILGNTVIDMKGTIESAMDPSDEKAVSTITSIGASLRGLTEERDNALYAPNYPATPVTSSGPMTFIENIAPRMVYGVRHDAAVPAGGQTASMTDNVAFNKVFVVDDSYATPATGLPLYQPASNAGVKAAAAGAMSHRDFFGNVRPAGVRPSQGAIEAA